jgi:hypothetical protein
MSGETFSDVALPDTHPSRRLSAVPYHVYAKRFTNASYVKSLKLAPNVRLAHVPVELYWWWVLEFVQRFQEHFGQCLWSILLHNLSNNGCDHLAAGVIFP